MIRAMHISARSTLAASLVGIGVAFGVFVSVLASGLSSLGESRRGAGGVSAEPASQVFLLSDGLQMIGVNAAANAAEMVNLEPFRNLAHEQFVSHAMGFDCSHFAMVIYLPISPIVKGRHPQPATGIRLWGNIGEESVYQRCYSLNSHVISYKVASDRAAQCGNTVAARSPFYLMEVA